ncbi:MAG: glycosyltransferase [Vicingaceae bacterium]|nr:glycosyltransferase [Flavobacteriales bacterium]WKZ75991.1 MAG: glycosyltransferase [Vicingaceae bacterium]
MTDALGQSQVLSYLVGLSKAGNQITLISFEKKESFKKRGHTISNICSSSTIKWVPLKYTSRPPVFSTLYDIIKMRKTVGKFVETNIVHCRGYITALVGLKMRQNLDIKLIFDMRGFWADEKLESGHWKGKIFKTVYNYFKKKESQFFKFSDVIISLTENGKEYIASKYSIDRNKIKTIPTCVNLDVFESFNSDTRDRVRKELGISLEEKVMIYSGSVGGSYNPQVISEVYISFKRKYKQTKLIILTKTIESSVDLDEFKGELIMLSVNYNEVSNYLIASDLGLIFYTPGFSNIGRYPTKLAEYWACGLPVVVFNKVGDTQELLNKFPQYGFYYFNKIELNNKLESFNLNVNKLALRETATLEFSLKRGVLFYDNIYTELLRKS